MTPFVFDRPLVLERLGGDEDIMNMMLDMFVQDVESNCVALLAAQTAGEASVLQREAHTIKALLATVSDEAGAEAALVLEKQAQRGDLTDSAQQAGALAQRMRDVAEALRGELAG